MLADASMGKIYFLNMWDDSSFRTYHSKMVWYIIYDDSPRTYINMITNLTPPMIIAPAPIVTSSPMTGSPVFSTAMVTQ